MSLVINTNLASINAQRRVGSNAKAMQGTFSRISSGLRINTAADDAAGLAISESLDAENRSVEMAKRNVNDGLSLLEVAEGAAGQVGDMLKRLRELTVQASSGTLATTERDYLDTEAVALVDEINRIADTTEFNGIKLSDGSQARVTLQVGTDASTLSQLSVSLVGLNGASLDAGLITAAGSFFTNQTTAQGKITVIDNALQKLNEGRSTFGAYMNRLDATMSNLQVYGENLTASRSRIVDADYAKESADLSKRQVMQQAGVAILGQANQLPQGALRLIG